MSTVRLSRRGNFALTTGLGFIAIASLLWGIYLSIYLARMWEHLLLAHRESDSLRRPCDDN